MTCEQPCDVCLEAGELGGLRDALQWITGRDQLYALRAHLRHPGRFDSSPGIRLAAADVLEAVCRRLIVEHGEPAAYFGTAGDVPPAVPDTPEGLS